MRRTSEKKAKSLNENILISQSMALHDLIIKREESFLNSVSKTTLRDAAELLRGLADILEQNSKTGFRSWAEEVYRILRMQDATGFKHFWLRKFFRSGFSSEATAHYCMGDFK